MRLHPRHVWPTLILVGVLAEYRSLQRHDGATLSEWIRALFRVKHPVGKILFVLAWCGMSWWLIPHILRAVDDALVALEDV